jgi:hypothetical protein
MGTNIFDIKAWALAHLLLRWTRVENARETRSHAPLVGGGGGWSFVPPRVLLVLLSSYLEILGHVWYRFRINWGWPVIFWDKNNIFSYKKNEIQANIKKSQSRKNVSATIAWNLETILAWKKYDYKATFM